MMGLLFPLLLLLSTTGSIFGESEVVSRTKIGLLGIDIVKVTTEAAIRQAERSGDLVRTNEACPELSDIPWPLRQFFAVSRFYYKPSGFFVPLHDEKASFYRPCRRFLDNKFRARHDSTKYVLQAADILVEQPESEKTDKALYAAFVRALASRYFPQEIPDSVLRKASKQVPDLGAALNPLNRGPSKRAVKAVCAYMEECLRQTGDLEELPEQCIIAVAHICFAINLNGPALLRELAKDPKQNVEQMVARLGRTENAPRFTLKKSTLGGLLPENEPTEPRKTIVLLNVRSAAQETLDVTYAFGAGSGRACAAKPAILGFLKDVQSELLKRQC